MTLRVVGTKTPLIVPIFLLPEVFSDLESPFVVSVALPLSRLQELRRREGS